MCAMKTRKLSVLNKPSLSYCHGCLSSDRALSVLGELVDIFLKMCVYPYKMSASKIYLCWECIATLKRLNQFKNRVIEAQKILQINKNKINNEIICLSSLKTVTPNDTIEITHTDEEKPIEVKEEIEINYDDTADFSPNEDDMKIPKEETEQPKTYNFPKSRRKYIRNKHYKFLIENKKDAMKSFKIDFNEIETWRQRDLKSKLFVKFKYKCVKCIAGWNIRSKYEEHNKKYHGEPPGGYTCATCGARVGSKPRLRAHVAAHGAGLACALCEFSSASPALARAHLHAHRAAVQCLICGARLKSRKAFYKHYSAFHKLFVCDHCGKKWKSKDTLEKHIRKYHTTFECKSCDIRFKHRRSLHVHVKLKHELCAAEDAYCAPCDLQFDTRALYQRHVTSSAAHAKERKNVTAKKKVPCPICGKEYTKNAYMMNHYRHVHMNQSKYYCNLCDTAMLNRTAFVRHTKTKHEGVAREKNKICNVCGRGFAEKRILTNHMRTHSGERPFECTKCGKRFTQKYAMVLHARNQHGPGKSESKK